MFTALPWVKRCGHPQQTNTQTGAKRTLINYFQLK